MRILKCAHGTRCHGHATGGTIPNVTPDLDPKAEPEPASNLPSERASALPRRIAHLDMDAFFASVELLRYPASARPWA